jgi:predicted transcriptional regulator
VRTVQSAIRPARQLAYTTVMTTMDRMFKKGLLVRKLKSRAHVYEPAVPYSEVREAEVDRLIQDYFAGSKEKLIDFLGGEPGNGRYEPVESIGSIPPHTELDETLL